MSHLNDPTICQTLDCTEMYNIAIKLHHKVERLTTELNSVHQQLEWEINRQSEWEKNQMLLQTVISHAPIVLWLLDQNSRLTVLDGKGLENSGIDPSRLIGQSIVNLYCNYPDIDEIIALVLAGNDQKWIAEIGDLLYENRAVPRREKNGQIVGVIGICTDITLRYKSEAELQKAKVELELRVEERTAALKESNDQLVIEIVEHLQAQKALSYRVEFEQLIATLSTKFINLEPEEIDSGISHALKAIATFSGVDRSYLFLLDQGGTQIHNTHEWCAPSISPQIDHRKYISVASLDCWQKQIYQLETIYIPSVAKLPRSQRKAKAILRSQSIQSLIVVPMTYRGSLIGFLGFDAVKVEKIWSEDIIALLRIVGEMFVNALDRKRVKEALKESEKKYRNFVETSQDLIWSVDIEGNFTFINSAAKRIYGWEPAEIIGHKLIDFLPSEQQKNYLKMFDEQISAASHNTGQICPYFPYETIHLRRDGTPVYLSVRSIVHKGENDSILGITGTATDISDRKRAEAQKTQLIASLQESERKFRSLYEATSDAVMLLDEKGFFDCNRATLKMFGCNDQKQFCGKHPMEFSPSFQPGGEDSISLAKQQINRALETGSNRFEWVHQRLDNSTFPAEVLLSAMEIDSKKVLQAVVRDITERKRDEEEIKASLAEKEVLLKEIHHRVKNNLQVISSLLRLQSRYIQDRQIIEMLKESQNRVRSMALVHEQLYHSKNLSRINFSEYIHNLATNLFQAYEVNKNGVKLNISVATIYLNIDIAVNCGLIINELVSNSLKYAFVDNSKQGNIHIQCLIENQQFRLSVSDNGIGFPMDLDFRNSGSLGLRLVCSLVNQLRGNIDLNKNNGTTFTITFHPKDLQ
jgi:PAS domain S-box-containing protein